MELSLTIVSLSILIIPSLILSILNRLRSRSTKSLHPTEFPGPTQFPLIGRVHDLPKLSLWLKFKEWADIYGPIYQTSMMGQKFIIVSNEEIANDLLVKKGNHFAGRPQIRALIDHKLGPTYVALQDRHETWKSQRKWIHAAMAAAHQHHFYGHIEREIKRFLMTLLIDPDKFHSNTRELTGRIMCTLSWDDAPQGKRYGDDALATLRRMSVSGPIVNTVTPLWHISDFIGYNPWRKFENERITSQHEFWLRSLRVAKKRFLNSDLPSDTWSHRYFAYLAGTGNATLEQSAEEELYAACMLGFQNLLGVVTISGPAQYFLMAIALHPEWQRKAQEEIDRVCGDRMPSIDDYADLPTVRACIKETLRWRSGVPLGVPHQCEEPYEYKGVRIEKGTIILACEWSISRIPEKYPDPEAYRPERWLESGWPTYMEPLSRYPNLREGHGMHTFGWGRRTCLGQNIADDEMFLIAASVCWGFNMSLKKCPMTGEDITFDTQATNSNVILEPKAWPMEFRPRSQERADTIAKQFAAVRDKLKV
ncbi:Cytochrome P450 monooxygenase COX1-like protein [Cladobotryum mycophilum]|uniref:Cytochrome P450 monooxygenase COX1-like protein n=1 Tax=Cladobotryum mycophilum TaxID=491253 RepID=A0ABR0SP38_9HYPO